jgi:branched-chain amino acid transport system substrate-binding protein
MAADFPDLMPKVYGTAVLPFPVNFTTAEGKSFGEGYKKLHNKEPDYLGQFGYVQSMLLFEAIARAADKGTIKKGGVIEEMRKTDTQTLIGRVRFDANGDNPGFVQRMGQHQGKQVVLVWPKEAANGKPAYPGVPW